MRVSPSKSALILCVPLMWSAAGCGEPEAATADELKGMALLARVERSPTHVIAFLDTPAGIIISERGTLEDLSAHTPLDTLRGQGIAEAYRALARDGAGAGAVPPALISADTQRELRERERLHQSDLPGLGTRSLPPASAPAATAAPAQRHPSAPVDRAGPLEKTELALAGDAAWWASLPICQTKQAGQTSSGATAIVAWYDGVWCPTGVTWATTGFRDTMYYEATAFGQGGVANIKINKWVNGAWTTVVNTTVGHRFYQTFSFPPENGAFYQTFVTGTNGAAIGMSERYRLAMPQPGFLNNKPNNVEYQFANDLQGITHDANNWYLTRTQYDCVSILCTSFEPKYGEIAKVPLTTSLGNAISGRSMPNSWRTAPGGGSLYHHFGDLVHLNGRLYVGMDGHAGGAIAIINTDMTAHSYAKLNHNSGAAFVAYNPQDGFFYVPSGSRTFEKYLVTVGASSSTAQWKGTLTISQGLSAYQGAKFSPKGNLWLLNGIDSSNREFYGIDTVTGAVLIKGGLRPGDADESQGLDIFDLDVETRPGMSGQLHLQLLNNQVDDDNWWLMHWRAPMGRL